MANTAPAIAAGSGEKIEWDGGRAGERGEGGVGGFGLGGCFETFFDFARLEHRRGREGPGTVQI